MQSALIDLLFAMGELLMLRVTCIQASLQLRQMSGWSLLVTVFAFGGIETNRGATFFLQLSCATKSSEHDQVATCLNL